MHHVKKLYEQLSSRADVHQHQQHPHLENQDGKIHILYAAGILSPSGFYRQVQPYFELNRTTTHRAIIANLHKWNYTQRFADYDSPLDAKLLRWADVVVFPATFADLCPVLESIREINPGVSVAVDVDVCFHQLPDKHPLAAKISVSDLDQLLVNLVRADLVTTASAGLAGYYRDLLQRSFRFQQPRVVQLPNLVSEIGFPGSFPIKRNTSRTLRFGLVANPGQLAHLEGIADALRELAAEYKGRFELVVLGVTSKQAEKPLFEGIPAEFHSPVSILNYYRKLNDLKLDVGLLPTPDTPFSKLKSDIKLVELGALGVPAVVGPHAPYSNMVQHGDSGLIVAEMDRWAETLAVVIDHPQLLKDMGEYAFRFTWRNRSWSNFRRQLLTNIYS